MEDSEDWAKAIRAVDVLRYGHSKGAFFEEPRLAIQGATGNVVLCDAPVERFSTEMPSFAPSLPAEAELRPIDILYGSYDPDSRAIEIYFRNIQRDAHIFGEFEDVLEIVRLHEYAHAVVHLGVRSKEIADALTILGTDGCTDWKTFLQRRRGAFGELDSASHEFLAQAITFASLMSLSDSHRSARLRATFDALESKQPVHYIVPTDIKACAQWVDWSLVLAGARRDVDAFRGCHFSTCDGLLALAREFTPESAKSAVVDHEWVVELADDVAVTQLRDALSTAATQPGESGQDRLEFLVDRFAGLRVEIFAREHPPPHFRVACGSESGNYRIADCSQLNGGLHREYRAVRAWHAENKRKLIEAWNRQRPSDCPVGPYREA